MKLRQNDEEFHYARDLYKFIEYVRKVIGTRESSGIAPHSVYEFPEEPLSGRRFEEISVRHTRVTSLLLVENHKLRAKINAYYYPGIRYTIETCPSGVLNKTIKRSFEVSGGYVGGFERGSSRHESGFNINSWSPLNSHQGIFEDEDEMFRQLCVERERINQSLMKMVVEPDKFIVGLDHLILRLEQSPPNEKKPIEVSATYKRVVTVNGLEIIPKIS